MTTTQPHQKDSTDAAIESLIFGALSAVFGLAKFILKFGHWTIFWTLFVVGVSSLGNYMWIPALLLVILPLGFTSTRRFGIVYGDYRNILKEISRSNGNDALRKMGLVPSSDETRYRVFLSRVRKISVFRLSFEENIPGLSEDKIMTAARDYRQSLFRAIRFEQAKDKRGNLVVNFYQRDLLAEPRSFPEGGDLKVRIGRLDNGANAYLDFSNPAHMGMQGQTRSGKSALTYGVLAQLASCEELDVWGIDPAAVLLKPFEENGDPSHYVTGGRQMEDAVPLLEGFVAEMEDRIEQLQQEKRDKFSRFTKERPVRLLVLEEYSGLLAALDALDAQDSAKDKKNRRKHAESAIGRLVREGAKVGIVVLFILQRADSQSMNTNTRDQLSVRITMKVGNKDAIRMFHEDLPDEIVDQVRDFSHGRMIFETPKGRRVGQADYLAVEADPNDGDALYRIYRERVEKALAKKQNA